MKAHFICPVRLVTEEQQREIDEYAELLVQKGYIVHNPKYSVDQTMSGYEICKAHLESMRVADVVVVFWNDDSKGSHFDLGIAFALDKKVHMHKLYQPLPKHETYGWVLHDMDAVSQALKP